MWRGVGATGAPLAALVAATPAVAHATGDTLRATQWYLDATGADLAQRAGTGARITVAVLDTGVDADHPDLAGAVVKGPDLIGGDDDPSDESGHVRPSAASSRPARTTASASRERHQASASWRSG